MRIDSPRDLGLYIRDWRRRRGMTQVALAEAAGVSRRWLSNLEAGKATAEIGLVLNTVHALDLVIDVVHIYPPHPDTDPDKLLRDMREHRDEGE